MLAGRPRAAGFLLGLAIVSVAAMNTPPQAAAATRHGVAAAKHRPTFRPTRAAAQEAARLGTAVGNGCNGRADIQRNDHEWVVLCSNGKTYVLEMSATPHSGAPATQCSLAGTGPEPACFSE